MVVRDNKEMLTHAWIAKMEYGHTIHSTVYTVYGQTLQNKLAH